MKRILLMRAREDIPGTANKLRKLGFEVVPSPVLKIVGTGDPVPAGPFDAVLATSEKAIEFSAGAATFKSLPLHVVGGKTARAAEEAGWRIDLVAENADDLVARLFGRYDKPSRFLYLAGRDRKPHLEKRLTAAGHTVSAAEIYEARAEERLQKEARGMIADGAIDYALHYSRRSASIFLDLAGAAKMSGEIANIRHLAMSEDVATPLRSAHLDVITSPQPTEESLLSLLPPAI